MPFSASFTAPFLRGTKLSCFTFFSSGKLNTNHHTAVRPKAKERQNSMASLPRMRFIRRKISSGMVEPPM